MQIYSCALVAMTEDREDMYFATGITVAENEEEAREQYEEGAVQGIPIDGDYTGYVMQCTPVPTDFVYQCLDAVLMAGAILDDIH